MQALLSYFVIGVFLFILKGRIMMINIKENERLSKLNPKQTIEVDGRITTIEGLSPQEIRRIVENSLDENDLKQLEIDAWYNSGGFKDERYLTEAQRQILSKSWCSYQ